MATNPLIIFIVKYSHFISHYFQYIVQDTLGCTTCLHTRQDKLFVDKCADIQSAWYACPHLSLYTISLFIKSSKHIAQSNDRLVNMLNQTSLTTSLKSITLLCVVGGGCGGFRGGACGTLSHILIIMYTTTQNSKKT